MDKYLQKSIAGLYCILIFFTPLILFTKTSEIFEFNKIVFIYVLTILIAFLWLVRSVLSRQLVFKRSLLTIPILIFVFVQAIATYYSIDVRTSIFGLFGRYHGGLLSTISYAILYFAFISNVYKSQAEKMLKLVVASATFVAIYGVLQKFGIDKHIWVQAVQSRVFSTFGQPNWLAAFLVAVIPLSWVMAINNNLASNNLKSKLKHSSRYLPLILSLLFFIALVFTRSRSGMLGFITANIIFWPILIWKLGHARPRIGLLRQRFVKLVVVVNIAMLVSGIIIGVMWMTSARSNTSPSLGNLPHTTQQPIVSDTFEIRKILWEGAVKIWQENAVLGTGPETFGYTYYWHRPARHNQTIEWDYLYNKAHNEYLNFGANTGAIGFLSYSLLIVAILWLFIKPLLAKSMNGLPIKQSSELMSLALLSGFVSILVTNFFGFSVVSIALLFFLYPAILVVMDDKGKEIRYESGMSAIKIVLLIPLILTACYLLLSVGRYWYSDYLYASGKALNQNREHEAASNKLVLANEMSQSPVYLIELSDALANLSISEYESHNNDRAYITHEDSRRIGAQAIKSSPYDVTLANKYANTLVKLAAIETENMEFARDLLDSTASLAPTDPKTLYNLGLTYFRTGDKERALEKFIKSIELKPDYKEPRFATALLYEREGETEKAIEELKYILLNIDPTDLQTLAKLETLSGN